jgi:hypothetical protein
MSVIENTTPPYILLPLPSRQFIEYDIIETSFQTAPNAFQTARYNILDRALFYPNYLSWYYNLSKPVLTRQIAFCKEQAILEVKTRSLM